MIFIVSAWHRIPGEGVLGIGGEVWVSREGNKPINNNEMSPTIQKLQRNRSYTKENMLLHQNKKYFNKNWDTYYNKKETEKCGLKKSIFLIFFPCIWILETCTIAGEGIKKCMYKTFPVMKSPSVHKKQIYIRSTNG